MNVNDLSDETAVKALALVGVRWLEERGVEAYVCLSQAFPADDASRASLPVWAAEVPEVTSESAAFCRQMLSALSSGSDPEVSLWAQEAVSEASSPGGHVLDPLSLAIGGVILIASILASRVKKVGSIEFYEGVPEELGNVIKAGAAVVVPGV